MSQPSPEQQYSQQPYPQSGPIPTPDSGQFPAQNAYPAAPYPAQGGYQTGGYPAPGYPPQFQNGVGTGGFVTGLLGLIFFWFPYLGIVLCVIGVALSGVGLSKANKGLANNKGLAIAGLVCGTVGLVIDLIFIIAVASALSGV